MSENDIIRTSQNIILTIRRVQVMIDTDLAQLYDVETKALNQAVKRNILRFPEAFRFQLTEAEKRELVTNCDRFNHLKHSATAPYAFTEQGVAMLSAVLRSDTAVKVSIQIMQAFVSMRRLLAASTPLLDRLDTLEKRQIANEIRTDDRFERILPPRCIDERPGQKVVCLFTHGKRVAGIFGASAGGFGMMARLTRSAAIFDPPQSPLFHRGEASEAKLGGRVVDQAEFGGVWV